MDYNPAAMTIAPKVFLSHASEDKDRFVMRFATALLDGVTHVHHVSPSLKRALECAP
jgi:hypothetical protein